MNDDRLTQLAREGHGAIQVDEPTEKPIKVVLAGPIKHWWSLDHTGWDQGIHHEFLVWRAAVETAFVKAGFLVYLPHKAWRGAWHEDAQLVNDEAINIADALVYLTPDGIPDDGTQDECKLAYNLGVRVMHLPPGAVEDIDRLIEHITTTVAAK